MRLITAIETLQRIYNHAGYRKDDLELAIVVHQPGSVGGTPSVAVSSMQSGFDWDAGKILLTVADPVSRLSHEDVAAIHASVREGQSWHAHQTQKQLKARIADLERQLASALAANQQ